VIDSMTALEHNSPHRAFCEFGIGLTGFLQGLAKVTGETQEQGEPPHGTPR
jgi:hypothetical protein